MAEPHGCPEQVSLEAEDSPETSQGFGQRALLSMSRPQVAWAARLCSSCGEWLPPWAFLLPLLGSHPNLVSEKSQEMAGSEALGSVGMWALLCPCPARYHQMPASIIASEPLYAGLWN
jgi:hypothetical protein